jgi:hypothetical protein
MILYKCFKCGETFTDFFRKFDTCFNQQYCALDVGPGLDTWDGVNDITDHINTGFKNVPKYF